MPVALGYLYRSCTYILVLGKISINFYLPFHSNKLLNELKMVLRSKLKSLTVKNTKLMSYIGNHQSENQWYTTVANAHSKQCKYDT
jgi:hypothetical protein